LDLQEVYNRLLFFINKFQGSWYPPETLDSIVDEGQMSYYKDCYILYGKGQRLTDALAAFKTPFLFTIGTTPGGLISTPSQYLDLLSCYTIVMLPDGTTKRCPVPLINEDEITGRINSQVIPNTTARPFGELVANWDIQLYPQVPQAGGLSYYARPPAPHFAYTLTNGGRTVVYNQGASTQLAWSDDEINPLLIATLRTIGINMSDREIQAYANQVNQENLMSIMKV
jgi:hypothetical protein